MPGDGPLRNPAGVAVDDLLDGVDQLGSTAVVEGDGERQPCVVPGQGGRLLHASDQAPGHPPVPTADEPDTNVALVEFPLTVQEDLLVELEEELHLVDRAAPVLG